jgi:hypothetical protein
MIHPLFRLVAAQPQMVADHLGGYCELLGDELRGFGTHWTRRLLLQVAAVGLMAVAVSLAGVAVLLWAVTAPGSIHAVWALAVVPLAPLGGALACAMTARGGAPAANFAAMRQQIAEDARMLREAAAA